MGLLKAVCYLQAPLAWSERLHCGLVTADTTWIWFWTFPHMLGLENPAALGFYMQVSTSKRNLFLNFPRHRVKVKSQRSSTSQHASATAKGRFRYRL